MPPRTWIHQTDLFRPHADPDDHYDLACVYALAGAGHIHLAGTVIDWPPVGDLPFSPDAVAVAQMNHLAGLAAPFVTGSGTAYAPGAAAHLTPRDRAAVRFVLETLERSAEPVVIHLVGSCRDLALALDAAPALFRARCAGLYLNAGQGAPDPDTWVGLEYNVAINAAAYKAVLEAPCPVYWVPCYHAIYEDRTVREYASWWDFEQGEVLPALADELQNYFLSMLSKRSGADWHSSLRGPVEAGLLAEFSKKRRNMWSTAGFLHAAGHAVTRAGEIVPLDQAGSEAVFGFEPVNVQCDDTGKTRWTPREGGERHIFRVYDTTRYAQAMTQALRSLLRGELVRR